MAFKLDQDLGFAGASTTVITVSGTFPAGALILVAVGFSTATSGQSLSQSGNAFTTLFTRENSATNNLVYFAGYISNWAGGALSTTFTLSSAGIDAGARLLSFTGGKTISPLITSKDAGGAPSSATFDSGIASGVILPRSLVVGFFEWSNTADISGTQTPSGSPDYGWTQTARSAGSSGTTPHGHAFFTWNIVGNQFWAAPQAKQTHTGTFSYGAQVAVFQEDFNPSMDAGAGLMQIASRTLLPANTLTRTITPVSMPLIATNTRVVTPVGMPLDATDVTRVITPVSMPLIWTPTRTITPVSMPLIATNSRLITPVSMPLIGTPTRVITPVSMPLIGTATRVVTPASMPLIATNTRVVGPVQMPLSAAGGGTRVVPVSMPLLATLLRVVPVSMPLALATAPVFTPAALASLNQPAAQAVLNQPATGSAQGGPASSVTIAQPASSVIQGGPGAIVQQQ